MTDNKKQQKADELRDFLDSQEQLDHPHPGAKLVKLLIRQELARISQGQSDALPVEMLTIAHETIMGLTREAEINGTNRTSARDQAIELADVLERAIQHGLLEMSWHQPSQSFGKSRAR